MFNFAINVILTPFIPIIVRAPEQPLFGLSMDPTHLLRALLSSIQRIFLLPNVVIDRFSFESLLLLHPVIEGLVAVVESHNCLYPSKGLRFSWFRLRRVPRST